LYAAGHAIWFEPAIVIRHHFSAKERDMLRRHLLNARNEFWSVLMRCPLPYVLLFAPLRVMRQFLFAASQGWSWLRHEPQWWLDAARGLKACYVIRHPVAWRDFWTWTRLARRPALTLADLESRFRKRFTRKPATPIGSPRRIS